MLPEVKTIRIDREVFQQTLEKKLADLPPLPAVVTRIMQTINNPSTGADELSRLIRTLEEEMHEAAADLRFEYAARLRDEIADLKKEMREVG